MPAATRTTHKVNTTRFGSLQSSNVPGRAVLDGFGARAARHVTNEEFPIRGDNVHHVNFWGFGVERLDGEWLRLLQYRTALAAAG